MVVEVPLAGLVFLPASWGSAPVYDVQQQVAPLLIPAAGQPGMMPPGMI